MPVKNTPYIISHYPGHPATPWKLEFRASFAGKRIKRFFSTRAEAEAAGPVIAAQIQSRGTESLEQKTVGTSLSAVFATFQQHKIKNFTGRHLKTALHVYKIKHRRKNLALFPSTP